MESGTTTPTTPRQDEILDHALALVREGGLAALTTRRLAARIGFSEAALYRHFPSKQALVLGLMDRLEAMLLGPVRRIARREELPIAARLREIVAHHTAIVRKHRSLPILLLAEASASEDPVLLDRMSTIFRSYLSLVEALLREGQARGEIVTDAQPDCLALLLVGPPAALAIRHRLLPDEDAEQRFSEVLVPFLVATILPDAPGGRSS